MEDRKGKRISHVTRIMDLPTVIMVNILYRLSIKSIFRCKTVCKPWYRLLTSDPLFVKMYHCKRSSNFPSLLLSINGSIRLLVELEAYDCHPLNRAIVLSPTFHLLSSTFSEHQLPSLTFSKHYMTLIGSCNGFICLFDGSQNDVEYTVYICNPLLGEYFEVKLPEWEKRIQHVAYAFCYSKASGQYKVLRSVVRKFEGHHEVSELDVYTLGVDEKWRNVGEAPEPLHGLFSKANVNGVVHWMDSENNDTIYSFNSWTEEVKSLPAPPGLEIPSYRLTLVELGNCLCLSEDNEREYVDIWWMKEYGIAESWIKDRILKDGIQPDIRCDTFIPISTWKDGEILMRRYCGTHVVSYNPNEKRFTKVKVYGGFEATSYFPSFYSLKTVVGESVQVSYVYPKIEIV